MLIHILNDIEHMPIVDVTVLMDKNVVDVTMTDMVEQTDNTIMATDVAMTDTMVDRDAVTVYLAPQLHHPLILEVVVTEMMVTRVGVMGQVGRQVDHQVLLQPIHGHLETMF